MGREYYEMSVTASNINQSFSTSKHHIIVTNRGDDTAYININAAATTNSWPIKKGETFDLMFRGISSIQAICDSGDTATLEVQGLVG